MIRVVRIIDRLNVGGPAKHVTWLTAGLDRDEFETTLFTGTIPAGEGDMSYFARAAGVEPSIISEMSRELSLRDVIVIFKLLREFFRLKPQIIHTHKAKAGAAGRVAAVIYRWMTPSALIFKPRSCKVVHTFHGHIFHSYYGPAKTKAFILIERALARFCTDRIVVISREQRREINEVFKIGAIDQFRIIPLGIDLKADETERGELRRELGIDDRTVLIGIVGRLCEVKNHAMFLEAISILKAGGVKSHFAIIGDGELREPLELLSKKLGVDDLTTFTGFREDAASLYYDLDIVALTSLNEGTPLTLIEAMSCGTPVVSTEVGGVIDIMGQKRGREDQLTFWDHGVTSPAKDAQSFAVALNRLIRDRELRCEMGRRGKEFVHSRMSVKRLISDIESLYREILK